VYLLEQILEDKGTKKMIRLTDCSLTLYRLGERLLVPESLQLSQLHWSVPVSQRAQLTQV
jgi:hypothetical protein